MDDNNMENTNWRKTVDKWFDDDGDNTFRLNYPLNKDSIVFDVGGYKGEWAKKISEKYGSKIFIFEPVPDFYSTIKQLFKNNSNVVLLDFGLSDKTETKQFHVSDDASSSNIQGGSIIDVNFREISNFIKTIDGNIDLIKINIEGDEYPLLKNLIKTRKISRFSHIQVQFHTFYPDAIESRAFIQAELSKTHNKTFDYPFVWESWSVK
jgi:FkbM family methyltransferase